MIRCWAWPDNCTDQQLAYTWLGSFISSSLHFPCSFSPPPSPFYLSWSLPLPPSQINHLSLIIFPLLISVSLHPHPNLILLTALPRSSQPYMVSLIWPPRYSWPCKTLLLRGPWYSSPLLREVWPFLT